jgi:NAD(P)-dependent dehydrogenase (short-subunit alcohol dehydrogenase family)
MSTGSNGQEHVPTQHQQHQPGSHADMDPQPFADMEDLRPSGKLAGKRALITGGDSGIGRAVAIGFAKEGADVCIVYLDEHDDAAEVKRKVEEEGQECILIAGDIGDEAFCQQAIAECVERLGGLDILVNNAAEQRVSGSLEDISSGQLERTFRTNIFAMFYLTKAALRHLEADATIINTTSVTAYRGSPGLIDYSSTKGAIVAFTRSLAASLVNRKIRVNAVAPGPIWTPLIPATFSAGEVAKFGAETPMERAGQPDEVAPSYVFLASSDAAYMTGQVLHPNGGEPVES